MHDPGGPAASNGPGDPIQRLGLPPASDALSSTARILQGAAVVDKQLLRQLPASLPVQLFLLLTPEKVPPRTCNSILLAVQCLNNMPQLEAELWNSGVDAAAQHIQVFSSVAFVCN